MSAATCQQRAAGSRKPPLLPVGSNVLRSLLSLSRPGHGPGLGAEKTFPPPARGVTMPEKGQASPETQREVRSGNGVMSPREDAANTPLGGTPVQPARQRRRELSCPWGRSRDSGLRPATCLLGRSFPSPCLSPPARLTSVFSRGAGPCCWGSCVEGCVVSVPTSSCLWIFFFFLAGVSLTCDSDGESFSALSSLLGPDFCLAVFGV